MRRALRWLPILPLALLVELGAVGWIGVLRREPSPDFVLYYWRARYALQLGWAHVYSAAREPLVWAHLPANGHVVNNDPLPLLWLVTPLALMPVVAAMAIWQAATIGSLVASVRLIAPRGRFLFWLIACFGFWPVTWSLMLGQVVPVICVLLAAAIVLLRDRREVAAGIVLTGIAIKPQLAFLVPIALLLSGYRRAFVTWAAGSLVVLGACLLVIGPAGVQEYARNLGEGIRTPATFHIDARSMLSGWFPSVWLGRAAEVVAGLVALAAAWRWRGADVSLPVAAGTLGSLLMTPFMHTQDLAVLFTTLGAYVAVQRVRSLNVLGYVSLFTPFLTPLPLIFELAWLGVLVVRPPAPAEARSGTRPVPSAVAQPA